MYICIDLIKNINLNDIVVIKVDCNGGIGVFDIGGKRVGNISSERPEGCLSYWNIASNIYNNRILAKVAIKCGDAVILHTDSKVLSDCRPSYERVEIENYGVLVPTAI